MHTVPTHTALLVTVLDIHVDYIACRIIQYPTTLGYVVRCIRWGDFFALVSLAFVRCMTVLRHKPPAKWLDSLDRVRQYSN
jgi:hypothetical protein